MNTKRQEEVSFTQFPTIAQLRALCEGENKDLYGYYQQGRKIAFGIKGEDWFFALSMNQIYEKARVMFGEYDPDTLVFLCRVGTTEDFECCFFEIDSLKNPVVLRTKTQEQPLIN